MNAAAHALRMLLKFSAVSSFCVSLGLQIYVLLLMLYDLLMTGRVGFASAFSYAVTQPVAIPAFIIAAVLTYRRRAERSIRWTYRVYFASHLIFWTCAFFFPGKFET